MEDLMGLGRVSRTWNRLGRHDPMWAVLTEPGKARNRWDSAEFLASGGQEIGAVLARLDELGARPSRGTALDFGCGAGRLTQGLAAAGFARSIGVDISAGMLATAAELARGNDRCVFLHNEGPAIPAVGDDEVDLVYCCRVLQHMPPDLALGYIREFFRILRPGGVAVFQVPTRPARNPSGLAVRLLPGAVLDRLRSGMEMHGIPERVVTTLVGSCGGAVLAVDDDRSAGPRWQSRRYLARR